jgi:ribosomal protein S18 acetylase RimI-like enzyme
MDQGQASHRLDPQILQINPRGMLPAVGALIRRGFATVAAQFGLTPQNCPSHPSFLTDETLLNSLCRRGVICFGSFAEEELIGFVAIWPKGRHTYEMTRLCTAPEFRHFGIGRALLDAAASHARSNGARQIEIAIIDEHEQLRAWYAACGFRETGRKEYPHLPFQVCEMAWKL